MTAKRFETETETKATTRAGSEPDRRTETAIDTNRDIIAPTWQKDDRWVARYRVMQPTIKNEWRMVEIEWEYRVTAVTTGRIEIRAHRRLPEDVFPDRQLFFRSTGQYDGYREGMNHDEFPAGPHFPSEAGWNAEALPTEWPAFALQPGEGVKYPGDVVQEVFADPRGKRVVLRAHDDGKEYDNEVVDRTMEQIWTPGRPWWSSIKIESVTQLSEGPLHSVEIEGIVTEWDLAERTR